MYTTIGIALMVFLLDFCLKFPFTSSSNISIVKFLLLIFEITSVINAGSNSPYFMRGILKNLEDMQKLPDEDFPFRKQVGLSFLCCVSNFLPNLYKYETQDLIKKSFDMFFPAGSYVPILICFSYGLHL